MPSLRETSVSDADASAALLAELFSSRVRALLLMFLVPRLDKRFSLTELSRELDVPVSSLQHECYKLERLGVLAGRREGGSRRYRVAVAGPTESITDALVHLVVTTMGIERAVQDAFTATTGLDGALIAGSAGTADGGALHLVLIGDLGLDQVQATLDLVARLTGHAADRIELAFFQPADWQSHRERGHAVVRRLLELPILVAYGNIGAPIGS